VTYNITRLQPRPQAFLFFNFFLNTTITLWNKILTPQKIFPFSFASTKVLLPAWRQIFYTIDIYDYLNTTRYIRMCIYKREREWVESMSWKMKLLRNIKCKKCIDESKIFSNLKLLIMHPKIIKRTHTSCHINIYTYLYVLLLYTYNIYL
jgi:hypothetical protein